MIKITNEVNGKLYELVPEKNWRIPCKGCAFTTNNGDGICLLKDDSFHGCSVCSMLRCIWKEVKDEKQYEYGVESIFDGHWIIEQTGFDELCEAKDSIDAHQKNYPEDKLRIVRRRIGKWEEVNK